MVSLVCEWLFSLVKAEVDQSFLKSCQEKNNPEPWFLSSFVPTIFFSILVFFHNQSRITGLQGKR